MKSWTIDVPVARRRTVSDVARPSQWHSTGLWLPTGRPQHHITWCCRQTLTTLYNSTPYRASQSVRRNATLCPNTVHPNPTLAWFFSKFQLNEGVNPPSIFPSIILNHPIVARDINLKRVEPSEVQDQSTVYQYSVRTSQRTQRASIIKINLLTLYRKAAVIYCQTLRKALCGKNSELFLLAWLCMQYSTLASSFHSVK